MIVATMTSSEITQLLLQDVDRVKAYDSHKEKLLMRELRKSHLESVAQSYEYHTDNADYIIVLRINRKGYVSRLRFAYIQQTLEYVSPVTLGLIKGIMSYSVHLLRRYAERVLHDKSLPIKTILLKFTKDFIASCLYRDGNRFVSGCAQGICLGEYDERRGILMFKTFVSLDMLKESQLAAWEKVERYYKYSLEVHRKYGLYSVEFQRLLSTLPDEMKLSTEEAQSIYSSYYEKDNEK